MLIETEIKIPVSSLVEVRSSLLNAHAAPEGHVRLVDTYYILPAVEGGEHVVRIRGASTEKEAAELTIKVPFASEVEAVCRHEVSVGLRDPRAMHEILVLLGARVAARVEKIREMYIVSGVPVYLDDVAGLGRFIEIGAPVLPDMVPEMGQRIATILRLLDLQDRPVSEKSYYELAIEGEGKPQANH